MSIAVSDYLATSYQPDREYVDGLVLERNVGEWDHSWLQAEILRHFSRYRELGLFALPALRMRVKQTRFRVPDIAVVRGNPGEQIITKPPFFCIEVLSPEDSMTSMQERSDDYVAFGVENLWIIDPRRRKAFWVDSSGIHEAVDGVLHAVGAPVDMDLDAMWPSS